MLVLFLAACSATGIPGITPYKINVQQGNVVTQNMLTRLKPGMTRSQVRYVMGTPLITDPFHPDRWDYVYSFSKHGAKPQERRITVVFDNDRLAHIEGDVVPQKESAAKSETPEGATAEAASPNVKSAPAGAASIPEGASSPASASESSGLPEGASSPAPQGTSSPKSQRASPSVPPRNISPPEPAPAAAGLPATPGVKPSASTPAGLKPVMPVAPPMGTPTDAQTPYPGAGGVPGAANNPPAAQ